MMTWNGDGTNHMDGFWGWFGGALMIGWMLLVAVGLFALVVWLVRDRANGTSGRLGSDSARDIIDARFARGEIDESQRRTMIETIT